MCFSVRDNYNSTLNAVLTVIDAKNVDPKNKKRYKTRFYEKIKNVTNVE